MSTDKLSDDAPIAGTQSLDRALEVLITIADSPEPGLTLAACSTMLKYSKATTHRMLRTLVARDFLAYDEETMVYSLGVANLRIGSEYLRRIDLRRIALPAMRELVAESRDTAHLATLSESDVVYIEVVDSPEPVRIFSRVGDSVPAFATGVGKAILAWTSADRLERRLPATLTARTENTITTRDALMADLAVTRERGFAIDNMENREGIRGYAAAIFDHTDSVVASVSIAGPAAKVTEELDLVLGPLVRQTADTISKLLGASANVRLSA
ncbi:IclR family transcriptional regulator [Salinibacterium sp. NSLL150]|uniref:IclR family transcriptional regulator n=1 Tax=unclassified Salinibacterium TaxID=2632331 RepID=UPI0018CD0FC7|nr:MULTISPECIES: IclR family transcriptional regulator [unclassified Salinibacterium]MBH0097520.1 IclR family transcriptional regulator [Salinibacterium sp. NSLL35]MBH0100275.1 IclR family transcriptional regulator [Salinibacterium sp. NSLL150]MBH0103034.1 IclR family transcriptional regulator [Salinibacterium sp. NSLL16]MBH0105795.1 IclR family transcriptional regulator [Salinibacterium sp. NSLL17]